MVRMTWTLALVGIGLCVGCGSTDDKDSVVAPSTYNLTCTTTPITAGGVKSCTLIEDLPAANKATLDELCKTTDNDTKVLAEATTCVTGAVASCAFTGAIKENLYGTTSTVTSFYYEDNATALSSCTFSGGTYTKL